MRRLIVPLFFVAVFCALGVWEGPLFERWQIAAASTLAETLRYTWQVGLCLALTSLLVRMINQFVWEGLVKRSTGHAVPQLPKVMTALLIYIGAAAIITSVIFQKPLTGFWTTSGVLGLVLGFALRNILLDLFMGLAINLDRSYVVGDWLHLPPTRFSPEVIGQVVDLQWRTTRIETEEKKIIVFPNSQIGVTAFVNFGNPTIPTRWELPVSLDFAVPVERARRVLFGAVLSVLDKPPFVESPAPQVLVGRISNDGVTFLIRFWMRTWQGGAPGYARDRVQTAILQHLRKAGLTPAYPKTDIFHADMPIRNLDSKSIEDRAALLAGIDLFRNLDDDEVQKLATNMSQRSVATHEKLIQAGDPGHSMFILGEGLLYVLAPREGGGENVRVAKIQPGEFFGELSLLTGEPRSATVVAASNAITYEITKDQLAELLAERPEVAERLSTAVAERRLSTADALEAHAKSDRHTDRTASMASAILGKMRAYFGRVVG